MDVEDDEEEVENKQASTTFARKLNGGRSSGTLKRDVWLREEDVSDVFGR